ncbi:ABC transporter [Ceratobasidium sp. AG-Ba]|nr:ABC transporter [Ceratobasidium sp. AG-Ba]
MFGVDVKVEAERVHDSQDALRVLDVSKRFPGGFTAVDNISFGVGNETLALLGPNGAGKTTTFNMIRGNIGPSEGDIKVCGKSIAYNQADARLGLGVTPQFTAVDSQLTVKEHLMIYGSLKACDIPLGIHGKVLKQNVDLLMEATALTKYADRLATKLSGGNGRKLSLALSLIGNPRVLLIDEYSTGVDAATKRAMWKTLRRVSHGKAVVITTHSMEEAAALSSRIGILAKRMLAIGTLETLTSRFSTYEVQFAARTPLDAAHASALMSRLPGVRQAKDLGTRYEVPIGKTPLAELFRTLSDQEVDDGESDNGIRLDYSVERMGLESVFLKVIQERDDPYA